MKKISFVLIILSLLVVCAMPVFAITYSQPDNGAHPYVGALVRFADAEPYQRAYCSGTLISSRIFVTAAHCGSNGSAVQVTFEENVATAVTLINGTFYSHPEYRSQRQYVFDVAVVVLDTDVILPVYGQLPTVDSSKKLPRNTPITIVGYGVSERVFPEGGGHWFFYRLNSRNFAVGSHTATSAHWIHISQNPAQGDAGACYGDSGGPNFYGDTNVIAAVTSTGDTPCTATNVSYRLDLQTSLDFINSFSN